MNTGPAAHIHSQMFNIFTLYDSTYHLFAIRTISVLVLIIIKCMVGILCVWVCVSMCACVDTAKSRSANISILFSQIHNFTSSIISVSLCVSAECRRRKVRACSCLCEKEYSHLLLLLLLVLILSRLSYTKYALTHPNVGCVCVSSSSSEAIVCER